MAISRSYGDHICYLNKKHAKLIAMNLLSGANSMFNRIYRIKHIKRLKRLIKKHLARGLSQDFVVDFKQFNDENLIDSIKICITFENYIKASLLLKGYLIHRIDSRNQTLSKVKHLAEKQRKSPVTISEFKKSAKYEYDSKKQNYRLANLADNTLDFTILLNKKDYKKIGNLPNNIVDILDMKRLERNILHFYLGDRAGYSSSLTEELDILREFIKEQIIPKYDKLVRELSLNFGDAKPNA